MPSEVFWGSPHQARLEPSESLPAKLGLILQRLNLHERVKGHRVAIKMHLGWKMGYTTIHPLLVRRVVEAVLEGGGKPFVTDDTVMDPHTRGYTHETLGCPIYPSSGIDDKWYVVRPYEYCQMTEFQIGGAIAAATFLIDLAHVKGHSVTGYGGAIKNLALGCMTGKTRGDMHNVFHYEPYFHKDRCPDEATRVAIRDSCPFEAIVDDEQDPGGLHLHDYKCNQCMRCQQVANGAFEIKRSNFRAFLEVNVIAAKLVLGLFEPGNAVFINIANNLTPLCDCMGFTGMAVMPDAGVFGADDIVAVEQAALDMTAHTTIIEENLPTSMEIVQREGHPWQWIHGLYKDPYEQMAIAEKMGLGSREYELVDVLPVEKQVRGGIPYVPSARD